MDSRDQARRLSVACPQGCRHGSYLHAPGRGLDASLPHNCERTADKIKATSFYLDGEGVVCGADGLAVFDRLHSKGHDDACFLYAFHLLEVEGEDLRNLALLERKRKLRALLGRRKSGIVYNDHMDGDGAVIFAHACKLGMEGVVSKRGDFVYRSGRTKSWLKIKNPKSPAMLRAEDGTF